VSNVAASRSEEAEAKAQFLANARTHSVIPVTRKLLADYTTPVAAFARLCRAEEPGFLLESVDHGGQWGRWSFIGRRAAARYTLRSGLVSTAVSAELVGSPAVLSVETGDRGILHALDALLRSCTAPVSEDLPPLHSGLVGYLGYDVVREVERLVDSPADDRELPDAILSAIGELAAYDHWRQQVTLIVNVYVDGSETEERLEQLWVEANARLDRIARDGASPLDEPLVDIPRGSEAPEVRPSMDREQYMAAVDVAKEHILAGDIFQVVLATRFDTDTSADPLDIYRVLRQINPSPYMFFVREPELVLVGCSPEPMVQLADGRVISRPIAGTRFRGATDEHDRRLAAELVEHPKERAEHIMLVDLARNDVGRVVEFGTCRVDELFTLERYSHVMHLTSQVSGALATGQTPIDVLRATLPAGTVSGAPKVRAMQIIDSLEPVRRGPYAGVVGYIDFSGEIDTAIAIRTMVLTAGDSTSGPGALRASVQAGAGIVADSDPADEFLETQNKAKALLVAIPAAEQMTRERAAAAGPATPPEGGAGAPDGRIAG
jgi:anthranilate synthase component 1